MVNGFNAFGTGQIITVRQPYPLIKTKKKKKKKGGITLKKNGYRVVNGANGKVSANGNGWRARAKGMDSRRKLALGSRPKNWSLPRRRLSAARALQALANVTKDRGTKQKAGVVRRRGMRRLTETPSKASLKKSRTYRKAAIGMMGLLLPIETGHLAASTGKKGGRPRGTYKHAIPGKGAVPVQQYRRWSAAQRRLQRMKDQQLIAMAQREGPHTSTASPEGQAQTMPEEMATRDTPTSYEEPEEMETTYEEVPQTPYRDVEQPGDYQEPPRSDNILNAPSIARGELRNERPKNPYKGPDDTVKPIVNPDGDYFTDVDPMTGKPILQKRIRERWLAGDDHANTR